MAQARLLVYSPYGTGGSVMPLLESDWNYLRRNRPGADTWRIILFTICIVFLFSAGIFCLWQASYEAKGARLTLRQVAWQEVLVDYMDDRCMKVAYVEARGAFLSAMLSFVGLAVLVLLLGRHVKDRNRNARVLDELERLSYLVNQHHLE